MSDTMLLPGRKTLSLRRLFDGETTLKRVLMLLICIWMTVVVILPVGTLLMKSLTNVDGQFVGPANYIEYFSSPNLSRSIGNS